LWNREHLAGAFSDQELCAMVTSNPADALEWTQSTGRLQEGLQGDVLVLDEQFDNPYRNLIASIERNVRLVLVGGKPRYGRTALRRAPRAEAADPIPKAGRGRAISLAGGNEPMTWRNVVERLEAVRSDPQAALRHATQLRAAGEQPFELEPDMPE